MYSAAARYLANVAGPAGTLLVLDDLHWAGQDALDLLTSLVRSRAAAERRLRVLGAYRDTDVRVRDPLAVLLADLAREGLAERVYLSPLPAGVSAVLFDLLVADLPDDAEGGVRQWRQQVVQRTGGVPFFLVSYAQGLR